MHRVIFDNAYCCNSLQMQSDGQKSLLDYFMSEKQTVVSSPSGRCVLSSPSVGKRTLSEDDDEVLSSTPMKKKHSSTNGIIVIDSDLDEDEENIFECSTKYRNSYSNFIQSPSEKNGFTSQSRLRVATSADKKKTTRFRHGNWSCAACTYSNHPLIAYCEMCNTRRDSRPVCSLTESSALVQSNLVAGSSSKVHGSASSRSSGEELNELSSDRHNSNNCLPRSQENQTQLPSISSELELDDVVMSQENESSNCPSPISAVGNNTSLLKRLNIEDDEQADDNDMSDSYMDKQLAAVVEMESVSESDIDFSNTAVHELFQFSCSRNSSRIYVYDKVFAAL